MSLTKVTNTMILGGTLNALDIGLIPNDATKRVANSNRLQDALAVGTSTYCVEFTDTCEVVGTPDTFYFESFTFPAKPVFLKGYTTLRNDSGVTLDFLPNGALAIIAPDGAPQYSRHSRMEGLLINTTVDKTAIYVGNGGLLIDTVWVKTCGTGLYVKESYGASYKNFGASAKDYGLRVGGGYVSINIFENIAVNNYVSALPLTSGDGIFLDGDVSTVTTANQFSNIDCSNCFNGLAVYGNAIQNTWRGLWMEANWNRDIYFDAVGTKTDTFIDKFTGTPAAVLTPDNFPSTVGRIQAGAFEGFALKTDVGVYFPSVHVFNGGVNVLDDYFEADWTPVLVPDGGTITMDAGNSGGVFTKVGRLVTFTGIAVVTSVSSPTGNIIISGLTIYSDTGVKYTSAVTVVGYGFEATMTTSLVGTHAPAALVIGVQKYNGAGSITACAADIKAGTTIYISGSYMAAT